MMEKIQRFLTDFIYIGISMLKILINSKFFSASCYRKRKDEKDVIILGNGPSLNDTIKKNIGFIRERDIICVNGFAMSDVFTDIKPGYYVIADQGYWIKDPLPATGKSRKILFEKIASQVFWPMHFCIPYEAKGSNLIKQLQTNKNITIVYYNKTSVSGFRWFRHFCYHLNLGIPRAENVVIVSLMLALNMGYKKVYLTGADHSWHETLYVDENNRIYQSHPHFFEDSTLKVPIEDIITGEPVKLFRYFTSLVIVFKNYWYIKEYAESIHAEIINISTKSYIDAFRREKI